MNNFKQNTQYITEVVFLGKVINLEDYRKSKERKYSEKDLIFDTIVNRLLYSELIKENKKD